MVTPLVFDLSLHVSSPDYVIARVYGSPEADAATGEVMRVNTLFPSKKHDQAIKGGMILVKLRPKSDPLDGANMLSTSSSVSLTVSYTLRDGETEKQTQVVKIPSLASLPAEVYDNTAIQKG